MIVRLGIYSGRENPIIILDGEQELNILRQLVSLLAKPCASTPFPNNNKLGYHGIKLSVDVVSGFEIYRNHITNGEHVWLDFYLEDQLLEIFRDKGVPGMDLLVGGSIVK